MKRLTERGEYGNADIIALRDMMPELYAELSFSESNALTDVFNRLADYEDTGLLPEEVTGLCDELKRAKGNEMARGFWRFFGRNYYTTISKCSCCGALYDFTPPHCPNCGAKMEDFEWGKKKDCWN